MLGHLHFFMFRRVFRLFLILFGPLVLLVVGAALLITFLTRRKPTAP